MVLATDAHNLRGRYPELREGYEAAAEVIGAKEARKLVVDNPMAIVHSQFSKTGEPASAAMLNMRSVYATAQQQAAR